jgi:hypothetical protein
MKNKKPTYQEDKNRNIAIVLGLMFTLSLIGNLFLVSELGKVKMDICYSLKVNEIFYEKIKSIGYEKNRTPFDNFESNFSIIKNRNWMGCEE